MRCGGGGEETEELAFGDNGKIRGGPEGVSGPWLLRGARARRPPSPAALRVLFEELEGGALCSAKGAVAGEER